jgi:hypothetical protein
MVVLGIAIGSGLIFRRRYVPGLVAMAVFFSIPLLTEAEIPWSLFAPMVLIGVGVIVLVQAFALRQPSTRTRQSTATTEGKPWT